MRWRRREGREPAVRIRYSARELRIDGRRGRRDGRKRIPTYTGVVELVEAGLPVVTNYHRHLLGIGRYEMNECFRAFLEASHPDRSRLMPLNNDLAAALRQVAQCREDLLHATAELTEDELRPRNPQEAAMVASGALLDRRRSMRRMRIEAARSRLAAARSAAQARKQAILDVHAQIAEEFALAQARGWRHYDRCQLRIGCYWEGLVQTHPEGPSLVSVLPKAVPDKPEWLEAARWQDTGAGSAVGAGSPADHVHSATTDADAATAADADTDAKAKADVTANNTVNADGNADADVDVFADVFTDDPDMTWPTPDGTAPDWLRQEF